MIDPTQPAGTVTTLTSSLGSFPGGIAFDGSRIWTANAGSSVSIVSLNPTMVTTISTGFTAPQGMLYDGSNIWVTDSLANTLLKLNADGSIARTMKVGEFPNHLVFDGTNIWVAKRSTGLVVVRVKDAVGNPLSFPFELATLTGNGLDHNSTSAAFDGERILIATPTGNSVSLWKAADLTPLGSFSTGSGTQPFGACSDGLNFWITLQNTNKLARF
jgi:hypothetical protein